MKKTTSTIERVQYSERCPKCKQEIRGGSESAVKYNLGVHIKQKHQRGRNET
jgi:uncharacterized protein with PIN domain